MAKKHLITMKYTILLFVALSVIWVGCEREVEVPDDIDYSYFPLNTGHFVDYRVDSVLYNDFSMTVDSSTYYVREEVGEIQQNNTDAPYNLIYRYQRRDTFLSWSSPRVWTARLDDYRLIKTEENLPFIRMVFPLRNDKKWDGLVHVRRDTVIVFDEQTGETIDMFKDWDDCVVSNFGEPYTVNGHYFPETATIVHVDKTNNIERRYSVERYAKGVGLIEKEMWILDTQCGGNIADCIGLPWEVKAEKGFIVRQSILHYGDL